MNEGSHRGAAPTVNEGGPSAGDTIPPDCEVIEVRVSELRQMFNAIDPSPFLERDLDSNAEEFITGWATEIPASAKLALKVYVERPPGMTDEAGQLQDAVRSHFIRRAEATRRRLRTLFRRGRISLVIGLAFLGLASWVANSLFSGDVRGFGIILRESLVIGGWVAMWRPLEVFLYDWWPILAEAKLYDRLAGMPVRIQYTLEGPTDAWRRDWPAVPAAPESLPGAGYETLR